MSDEFDVLAKIRTLKIAAFKGYGFGDDLSVAYANRFVIDMAKEFEKNKSLYGSEEAMRSLTEYCEDCEGVQA